MLKQRHVKPRYRERARHKPDDVDDARRCGGGPFGGGVAAARRSNVAPAVVAAVARGIVIARAAVLRRIVIAHAVVARRIVIAVVGFVIRPRRSGKGATRGAIAKPRGCWVPVRNVGNFRAVTVVVALVRALLERVEDILARVSFLRAQVSRFVHALLVGRVG